MIARLLFTVCLAFYLLTESLLAATGAGVIDFSTTSKLDAVYAAGYQPYLRHNNHFVLQYQNVSIELSKNLTISAYVADAEFSVYNDYQMNDVHLMSPPLARNVCIKQTDDLLEALGYHGSDFQDFLKTPMTIPGDDKVWSYDQDIRNISVHVAFTEALSLDGVVAGFYVTIAWNLPFDLSRSASGFIVDKPPPAYEGVPLEHVPLVGNRGLPPIGSNSSSNAGRASPNGRVELINKLKSGDSSKGTQSTVEDTSSLLVFITPWKVAIAIAVLVLLFLGWQRRSRG